MLHVSGAIKDVNQSSIRIVESIEQVKSSVGIVEKLSIDSERQIKYTENHIYASLIKLDHIIYKQHAYRALGNSKFTESIESIKKDQHQCRFGQWYEQTDTASLNSKNSAYQQIKAPHALVHQSVALGYHEASQTPPDEDEIIKQMSIAEDASSELIDLLADMVELQNVE
ncbi:CZB domain-containing protein [Psychromonas hadalis]|uniref:CZB domain-containing protein n=1 Tax=Psychromonas hadalis TaxID=211669 RepID=UPI0003B3D831|nr:CZB domain-containing protein [Psychromonas hadalis]